MKKKPTHREKRMVVKQSRPGSPFPLDMLRYDTCVPASESDANLIRYTIEDHVETLKSLGWNGTVLLRRFERDGAGQPTDARWRSFGWEIVSLTDVNEV